MSGEVLTREAILLEAFRRADARKQELILRFALKLTEQRAT